jgi:PhzF family phenazine biosynthesis protein
VNEKIYHVDAFTGKPFAGNPAAVCLLTSKKTTPWMQSVAAEMNLSETAFFLPEGDGYRLRWFTPKVEVELCGHATLASAHVLYETKEVAEDATIQFHTQSGLLKAKCKGDWVELDFPSQPPLPEFLPGDVYAALGIHSGVASRHENKILIELESESVVRALHPDFISLLNATKHEVIVTSKSQTRGFDFMSRFFAPVVGINEDPVTGSAHCVLTPYWSQKLGKKEMKAYQASERGGVLRLKLGKDRVFIQGQAVTVAQGSLEV